MANAPRKDNVVKFRKIERTPPGTPNPPPGRNPAARLRALLRGREGLIGLAVIVILAVGIVLWGRLG